MSAPPPLILAELDRPLPPLVVGAGETARTIPLRRVPVATIERLRPIAAEQGPESWAYLREILQAGAPDLTDAELDALSVTQVIVLGTLLIKGVAEAMAALQALATPEDAPPGGAPAGEPQPGSSAT